MKITELLNESQHSTAKDSEEKPPRMTHTCEKCGKKWQLQHHCKGKPDKKQGVAEGSLNEGQYEMMMRNGQVKKFVAKDDADAKRIAKGHGAKSVIRLKGGVPAGKVSEQGVEEGLSDIVKGVKRKVAGKADPKEVEHMYGRIARSAIKHKTPGQAEKDIERYKKVSKVVNKEGVAEARHENFDDLYGSFPDLRKDKKTGEYHLVHLASNHELVLHQDGRFKPLTKDGEAYIKRMTGEEKLDELSPQTLASYKQKAGAQASKLDKRAFHKDTDPEQAKRDIAKANKRFGGIVRATRKEFGR